MLWIRSPDALESRREVRRKLGKRSVSAIDVEPKTLPTANRRQGFQIANRADVDSSRSSDHQKRRKAGAAVGRDGFLEIAGFNPLARSDTGRSRRASLPSPSISIALPMQFWTADEA